MRIYSYSNLYKPAFLFLITSIILAAFTPSALAQLAVRGETVYTMAGTSISDGVVLVRDGKIERVGAAADIAIPDSYDLVEATVVTPGLVDAHTVVGIAGYLNQPHDQDQVERSNPIQPELRAIDAYNPREALVEWVRSFGVTTIHTGHGPGVLMSGQTMIAKTYGETIDEVLVTPQSMIATTLGNAAKASQNKSPGTRSKMIAMLRSQFLKAQDYARKHEEAEEGSNPPRDLKMEALSQLLNGELHLLVTVDRANDILTAIRLGEEFGLNIILDSAAEAYLVLDEIKEAGVPVILHPTMKRASGDRENLSMETASLLKEAGIPFALQSGFEAYVPKSRVLLFEAAIAAGYGLSFEDALASITIDAARILGIDDRVGSLETGKDADLALYDGDPFEYTSHCVGVIIDGEIVSQVVR